MNDPTIKFEVTTMDVYGHLFYETFDDIGDAVDYYRQQIKSPEETEVSVDIAVEIGGEEGETWVVDSHEFDHQCPSRTH